jgi:hypothetical protein
MDDGLLARIDELVAAEKRLREGPMDDESRRELEVLERQLDQVWDLMRQRDALRSAGLDPAAAQERSPEVVEGYES